MKKRLVSIGMVLVLMTSLLSGCHGEKIQSESGQNAQPAEMFQAPAEFDSSRQYEITFWAKNDTNISQVNIYKQTIADFEKIYPNIKVVLRLYTDYGEIYKDVITNIATDTTPNVCITYPDHIATYLSDPDSVVGLDKLFVDEKYGLGGSEILFDAPAKYEIVDKFLEECQLNGHYYALPYMRSTEACYINKDYVEKLGFTIPEVLTWDFVFEVSAAAMEKDEAGNFKVNGQKTLIPFIYKSTDNMMIQMLKQQGAEYSTADGEIGIFNDVTKETLFALGEQAQAKTFNTFKRVGYPANFLNAGQCIFAVDSTAGATWMGSDAPLMDIAEDRLVRFETEVRPIPQFDVNNPQMISQGPSVCIFNKEDPQEVLASWIFTQYLLTNEVQIPYSQTEGYVPVTTKAQNSAVYQEYLARADEDNELHYGVKLAASKLLLRYTENTFVTPVFNGSMNLRNAAGQLIEEVTSSAYRKQTIDEAYMFKLFRNMTSLYRLGEIDFGKLSTTAVVLVSALAVSWIGLGITWLYKKGKRKKSIKAY